MRAAKRILAISAVAVAFTASARTVYDAGKALRQNCESGSYANPYTDANGGVWSYYYASSLLPFSGTAFESTSTITSGKLAGWANWDHPRLRRRTETAVCSTVLRWSATCPITSRSARRCS